VLLSSYDRVPQVLQSHIELQFGRIYFCVVFIGIGADSSEAFLLFLPEGVQFFLEVLVDAAAKLQLLLKLYALRFHGPVLLGQLGGPCCSGNQV